MNNYKDETAKCSEKVLTQNVGVKKHSFGHRKEKRV